MESSNKRFKVGDRVTCVDNTDRPDLTLGAEYEVLDVGGGEIKVEDDADDLVWNALDRFALVKSTPTFKVGDKVRYVSKEIDFDMCGRISEVETRSDREQTSYMVKFDDGGERGWYAHDELTSADETLTDAEKDRLQVEIRKAVTAAEYGKKYFGEQALYGGSAVFGKTATKPMQFDTVKDAYDYVMHRKEPQIHVKVDGIYDGPGQVAALRYNASKPESDYILTYDGGVEATFREDFDYYNTMVELARLYRCHDDSIFEDEAGVLLAVLREDALHCGDDIAELLALTNMLGGIKYEPGNYLKGANWRQYFQSAVRHAVTIQGGDEYESDPVLVQKAKEKGVYEQLKEKIDRGFPMRGNLFFNILALVHCIRTGLGTDDRIRSTK